MSRDNFDKEIAELYQQRKAEVVAPQVSLETKEQKSRFSPLSLLGIFSAAGVASFGIMAIVSHLSSSPVNTTPLYNTSHNIEMVKTPPKVDEEKVVPITKTQPIPPKPIIKPPTTVASLHAGTQVPPKVIAPANFATTGVQLVHIPQLSEPKLAITPIYKAMPKYSLSAQQRNQSGMIQLNYQINSAGHVENITVVSSTINKKLLLSAKKALAKWQYAPSNHFNDSYDIIFEFNAIPNK